MLVSFLRPASRVFPDLASSLLLELWRIDRQAVNLKTFRRQLLICWHFQTVLETSDLEDMKLLSIESPILWMSSTGAVPAHP